MACSTCGHVLSLHFDAENGGPGPCQEDIGPDIAHLRPCPCNGAPEDSPASPEEARDAQSR